MKKYNYIGIDDIGNYYGGLYVIEYEGKYYWLIENYDTDFSEPPTYLNNGAEEISEELYEMLINHNSEKFRQYI